MGNVFSVFCNYLPLKKSVTLHFNKMNFHHLRMLCVKSGCNWLSGSWELDENVKSLLRDLHTDGGQYTIRKARSTSVTSKGVKCFKTHNTCYTDLPTDKDRLINEIINPISYRKKMIPKNIFCLCWSNWSTNTQTGRSTCSMWPLSYSTEGH